MLGALIGDIAGSRFEFHNHRSKDFELLHPDCFATDDSIMTLAIAKALMESKGDISRLGECAVRCMQELGRKYPDGGYGGRFQNWLHEEDPQPYHSWGNGAAMRISPVGLIASSEGEVKQLAKRVTEVTHNHPEGLKGAEAVAVGIFHARRGMTIPNLKQMICQDYYPIDFTLDEIRADYPFDESCQGTVPVAFEAFFESVNFEDAIRNAVSVGGDSDTVAAIAGSLAEAFYGIPDRIRRPALRYLDPFQREILDRFETDYEFEMVEGE